MQVSWSFLSVSFRLLLQYISNKHNMASVMNVTWSPGHLSSRHVIGLISWVDTEFACVRFKMRQATTVIIKFRGTSWIVTGIRAERADGLARHAVDVGLPHLAILPTQGIEVTLGWPYWSCPITSSTAGARFGRASLIATAQSPQIPPTLLHLSTVTRMVNLGHQVVNSPTHHWMLPRIYHGCALHGPEIHGDASVLRGYKKAATS